MKLCLHCHSEFSHDSKSRVEDIMKTALELGYDYIAITDHNTAKGSLAAQALGWEKPKVIPGAEYSTQIGHILAYGVDASIEKETRRWDDKRFDLEDLVRRVRQKGGLLYLAHPLNSRISEQPELLTLLDGFEVYNCRQDSFIWRRRSERFLKGLDPSGRSGRIGGPDAHTLEELKNCYMNVESREKDPLAALFLHTGDIYAYSQPNRSIAKAEYNGRKGFSLKKWCKYRLRLAYGIFEGIGKEPSYECVYDGKKFESVHKKL